jgi:hypothetical protein
MINNKNDVVKMGENAYDKLTKEYSSELHCNMLLEVFNKVIKERKK